MIKISDYIGAFSGSALSRWANLAPWELVSRAPEIVLELLAELPAAEYETRGDGAVHQTAIVEAGAVLKGPLIIGPHCFVASGAYLRGGCWIDEQHIRPGCRA